MSLQKNILNLLGTQVVGYIVPLLQLPYLSRVVGTDLLGLYLFSLSLVSIGMIITNFGFDLSVSKRIAEGENSKQNLGCFLYKVNLSKLVLLVFCLIFLSLAIYFSGYYSNQLLIISLLLVTTIGNAFSLNWLFQGLEKIYIYSRAMIITKVISLLFVFFVVKSKDDFYWLFILMSLQAISATLICFYIARKWGVKHIYSSYKSSYLLAKESSEFFLSRLGVSLYSVCGSFFLGILSGSLHQVALYGVAQQLYKAGVYALSAISTPLVPYMARTKNYKVFFKVTAFSMFVTLCGAMFGWIFGPELLELLFGSDMVAASSVLNVFMITIIFSVLGMHFGYPALIPLGKVRVANYSVIYSGLLQLILISILFIFRIPTDAVVIAITYLCCDAFMCLQRLYAFIRVDRMKYSD